MSQCTVAVVTNLPRPYRRALFATLQAKLSSEGMGLRVLYTSDPRKHLRRGSAASAPMDAQTEDFVSGISLRLGFERVVNFPTRLGRVLDSLDPCCVVAGGFSLDAMMAARWCRSAHVPLVIWSGAWGDEGGRIQAMSRRRLVRQADAFVAYGTAAADCLVSLGAAPDEVFCAWNTVDIEGIATAAKAAAARRPQLVSKYGLAARNLLFIGSLVERKGVRELLAAALRTTPRETDWALHLVGPGPLRDEAEGMIRAAGAESHFRLHGAAPPDEVTELLGVAVGLVLPAKREPWGLVVNEAMGCGVPVVASPWAGATRDLITDGITGYVVEPTDTNSLAQAMARLIDGGPEVEAVGSAGAVKVRARASLEKSAEGFVSAVRHALDKSTHARR